MKSLLDMLINCPWKSVIFVGVIIFLISFIVSNIILSLIILTYDATFI